MKRFMRILDRLPGYRRENLWGDITAGLTVAVMLIPQGMAYALLAGLPPIVGLYASLAPILVYALLGTSRQLAVGPVAIVSLMVASALTPLAEAGSSHYVALAALLAGMVGLIQLAMGVARLGFLVNVLAHPVVIGFTSAGAFIIGFSQLGHLLGIELPRTHRVDTILATALNGIGAAHIATVLIGVAGIVMLIVLKRWMPSFPAPIAVVAAGTLAARIFRLDLIGVAVVGEVPRGLPPLTIPDPAMLDGAALRALVPAALAISLVGFIESIAVAKVYAARNGYTVDADRELSALGAANIAALFFGGYPITGGFSRTAVNAQAGSRTNLSSVVTAGAVGATLLVLTPLFAFLPKALLAALVMVAVAGLVDVEEIRRLIRMRSPDLVLLLVAFVATLGFGMEMGVLAAVGVSLMLVIYRTTRPHSAVLGRLPGTQAFRNVKRYPEAETFPGLVVFRIDADLYFVNAPFFARRVRTAVAEHGAELNGIVFDCRSISYIDSTGERMLREVVSDLESKAIGVAFANVKGPIRDTLERSGFRRSVGEGRFFLSNDEAVEHHLARQASDGGVAYRSTSVGLHNTMEARHD
ncbi:MAG: solute carrier family 26 protein [Spirochaetales bacterium]|nr:solute carrier family 26 protein [Spirochaetales bacterium]